MNVARLLVRNELVNEPGGIDGLGERMMGLLVLVSSILNLFLPESGIIFLPEDPKKPYYARVQI